MRSSRNYEGFLEASHRDTRLNSGMPVGDMFGAMDKVQAHDEETQGSGSGSGVSDLSALENETDEFGKLLLQHQRDTQRMNALRGGQRAFRKARPRPRVAETLEREERERLAVGQNHQRTGSNESDPPVTVPREWGRRARRQTDWMRKILEPSEASEDGDVVLREDDGALFSRRTGYTGDLDWQAKAREAVPSVEDTPPSMRRQRVSSPGSSMNHMNTTLKPSVDTEDGDFTGVSFLASTPATTRLPRRIDELARHEVANHRRQGVAIRALDQMDQGSPDRSLRRSSSTRVQQRATTAGMAPEAQTVTRPVTAPGNPSSPSRIPRRLDRMKENVPPNGEVNGTGSAGLGDRTAQPVNIKANSQRKGHNRNDSMNLLRKLARVPSMSPSPAGERKKVDAMANEREADAAGGSGPLSAKSANSDYVADSQPPNQEAREGKWGLGGLLPGWQSKRDDAEVKPAPATGDVDVTPIPQELAQDAKTPVVTGAWVETTLHNEVRESESGTQSKPGPAPKLTAGKDAIELEAQSTDDNLRRIKSEPSNPKSALEAILRDTKTPQQDQIFGESTIQSLEDIVHPDLDPTDPTITFDLGALANAQEEQLDLGRPLTQEEKNRRQESLAMEALNKHLKAARTSIKDANRGLRRVENRIETAQGGEAPTHATTITLAPKRGNTSCPTCGGGLHHSVFRALWSEFRSLFYVYDSRTKFLGMRWGIRLNFLGILFLTWFLWYITESILCGFYCRPRYAYWPTDIDPNAPRWPFALPTLLLRPFRFIWGSTWDAFLEWIDVPAWEQWIFEMQNPMVVLATYPQPGPWNHGLADVISTSTETFSRMMPRTEDGWFATASATGVRVAQSVVDVVDEAGSIWDEDVFL